MSLIALILHRREMLHAGIVGIVHVILDGVEARLAGAGRRLLRSDSRPRAPPRTACRRRRRRALRSRPGRCGRARTNGRSHARRSCRDRTAKAGCDHGVGARAGSHGAERRRRAAAFPRPPGEGGIAEQPAARLAGVDVEAVDRCPCRAQSSSRPRPAYRFVVEPFGLLVLVDVDDFELDAGWLVDRCSAWRPAP